MINHLQSSFNTAVVVSSYYYPTTPEHLKCMYGRQRKAGDDVTCYQFHGQKCAKGFFCKGGPYDSEGTCCLVNNPCYVGKPVSTNGNAMSCGWVGEKCPKGTYCQRDYHNNYGVCCPGKLTNIDKKLQIVKS
ncbi:hypothetical protein FSP39_024058 [Pinctada imbricata]|uniref:Uncharacterized protein n=1 Tax=Pinctada imbricata TaxID=66713 RepID=A0AA89C7I3_PINIB|nr:hypothetical protein FSP39_024058 [Pinctada imbricata]